jgi:hypothetical protein
VLLMLAYNKLYNRARRCFERTEAFPNLISPLPRSAKKDLIMLTLVLKASKTPSRINMAVIRPLTDIMLCNSVPE